MRRRTRNTGGGRCSFTHSYLDSFDDLRAELRSRPVCAIWYKKYVFFMSLPFKPIHNGKRHFDRSSVEAMEFKVISSFIHISFYGKS